MWGMFDGLFAVSVLIYFLIVIFLLWLTYRFVLAHESMAEGINRIVRLLHERLPKDQ